MTEKDIQAKVLKLFPSAKSIRMEQTQMVSGGTYTTVSFHTYDRFGDRENYKFDYLDEKLAKVNGIYVFEVAKAEKIMM